MFGVRYEGPGYPSSKTVYACEYAHVYIYMCMQSIKKEIYLL